MQFIDQIMNYSEQMILQNLKLEVDKMNRSFDQMDEGERQHYFDN